LNAKEVSEWTRIRQESNIKFALTRGTLVFGGIGCLITFLWREPISEELNFETLLVYLVLWGGGGFFYGLWLWFIKDKKYKYILSENDKLDPSKK